MKTVKTKVLAPVLMLAIVAIVSSVVAITSANSLEKKGKVISEQYLENIKEVGVLSNNTQKMIRMSYSYIITPNESVKQTILDLTNTLNESVKSEIEVYDSRMEGDEDALVMMQSFKNNYDKFLKQYEKVKKSVMEEDTDGAASLAGSDMLSISMALENNLSEMVEYQKAQSDVAVQDMESAYKLAWLLGIVCLVFGVILLVLAYIIAQRMLVKPIVSAKKMLDEIVGLIEAEQGDLTMRIKTKANDEIGHLANGVNNFMDRLQFIIGKIVGGTGRLKSVIDNVNENVIASNDSAQDVSSAMEELSATMEEIAATVMNVSENADSIGDSVTDIADKTEEINDYSKDMKQRADLLSKKAEENKQQTNAMISNIVGTLKEAIEESKSVKKVNELTEDILSISSQTNLLALNASIEAARAGEAGKGFAVVADEIRELADSSRDTANNIQAINELVVKAVNALVDNSNAIIKFIDETVLPDYDGFVNSGIRYNEDAGYISDKMNDFMSKTEELKKVMDNMVEAVDGISKAIEESANAVTSSAMNTSSLVEEMNDINKQMAESQEAIDELMKESAAFKKF